MARARAALPEHGGGRFLRALCQCHHPDGWRAGRPALVRLHRAHQRQRRRILCAAAAGLRRYDRHERLAHPDDRVFEPGDSLPGALHYDRFQSQAAALDGSRHEVLLAGRLCQHLLPLRRSVDLRGHTDHRPGAGRALPHALLGLQPHGAAAAGGRGPAADRLWLQGGNGAVPHVDARRLPGRANARHRVHVGGHQDGRLRGAAACAGRADQPGQALAVGDCHPGRADHDDRQSGRAAPEQPQTPAGLFQHRPCRLHPGGIDRQQRSGRRRHALLPVCLRLHEHRRLCRRASAGEPGRDGC